MDGNQRWSKKNDKKIQEGYLNGFKNLEVIVNECINQDIKYVTAFALSTENLNRGSSYLIFNLIRNSYKKILKNFLDNKININIIGEKNDIPEDILNIFNEIQNINNPKINLNIAFNYGSQFELKNIIDKAINLNLAQTDLDSIRSLMYLGHIPDPELLIRTGGFQRLSNFMMLNLSYTELFFTKKLWPDFNVEDLRNIFNDYKKIKRNYGL
jgi:undecaprenyl diphosphate synthase